jgi:ABC-type branched-subunit amino acid transport system permease subunit
MVVASLPVVGSTVAYAGVAGPMFVPKRVTISPGETAPVAKFAPFVTDAIGGSAAVDAVG